MSAFALLVAGWAADRTWLVPDPDTGPTAADGIARMAERCVEQMVSDTCRAARDTTPGLWASPGEAVFVAGIGLIDGRAYDELRRNGEAMCSAALAACRADLRSSACVTAQQLWGPGASDT